MIRSNKNQNITGDNVSDAVQVAGNASFSGGNSLLLHTGDNYFIDPNIEQHQRRLEELYAENALKLASTAHELAFRRAAHFVRILLNNITQEGDELLKGLDEPRILAAIYVAQQAYAESGDDELGNSMAKLIGELLESESRTLKDVLLRQAIETMPRLASTHIRALAVLILLKKWNYPDVNSFATLMATLHDGLSKYYDKLPDQRFDYEYMSSCGVGLIDQVMQSADPYDVLYSTYPHLLSRPILESDISTALRESVDFGLLAQDPENPDQYTLPAKAFRKYIPREGINLTYKKEWLHLLIDKIKMPREEFYRTIQNDYPDMLDFFVKLGMTRALSFTLTSVGQVIGLESWKADGGTTSVTIDRMVTGEVI